MLAEKMMNDIKWIFFDLGWTLIDETLSHRSRFKATRLHLSKFGLEHTVEELIMLCQRAATDFAPSSFRGMLEYLNLTKDQCLHILKNVPYDHSFEILYPGVQGLLKKLSKYFSLCIIANQAEGTEDRLRNKGIRQYFSFVLSSAELGLSKPDPNIFQAALSKAECNPWEVVMVGDRIDNDIGPAKSQGLKTIRVLQGFSQFQKPRNPNEEPDRTISSILELPGILINEDQPTSRSGWSGTR